MTVGLELKVYTALKMSEMFAPEEIEEVRRSCKKQIPKKPDCTYIEDELDTWECPTCGIIDCALDVFDEPYEPKCCDNCGQLLDWSNDD